MQLAYVAETAAAVGAVASLLNSKKSRGAKRAPASAPRSASGPPASVNVSPAFQTKISPQISPVFSQIQDSAGASTYGAPTMTSSGAQYADTGSDLPSPSGVPRGTSRPFSPFDEYGRARETPQYRNYPNFPVVSKMGGYQDIIKWGIIGTIALFAIKSFKKPGYSAPSYSRREKTVSGTRLA